MKDRIRIYKEICESFVKQNDVIVEKVELVNDILFSQRLTAGIYIYYYIYFTIYKYELLKSNF